MLCSKYGEEKGVVKMKKTMFFVLLIALVCSGASTVFAQSVIEVDLGTLLREIDNNAARAAQLYGNKTIRTRGRIESIDRDSVNIGVGGFFSVMVTPTRSEMSKLINLQKGQTITVRGVFTTIAGFGYINNAVIEANPPPAAQAAPQQAPSQTQPQAQTQQSQQPQTSQQPAAPPAQQQPQTQQPSQTGQFTLRVNWTPASGLVGNLTRDLAKDLQMHVHVQYGINTYSYTGGYEIILNWDESKEITLPSGNYTVGVEAYNSSSSTVYKSNWVTFNANAGRIILNATPGVGRGINLAVVSR